MNIINDKGCVWLNQLPERTNIKSLDKDIECDYLIVGAGYTGLSAARVLSEVHKNKKIIIVDAQLAGEGGSSRNSGYLVDTTLNDGFTSNKDIENYTKKVITAMKINSVDKCVIAGGVAANHCLRNGLRSVLGDNKIMFPDLSYCTDNGAMISYLGEKKIQLKKYESLSFSSQPNLKLS